MMTTTRTSHRPSVRLLARAAGTVLAAALLVSCGEATPDAAEEPTTGASETPSETPSESPTEPTESTTEEPSRTEPACDDVWVDGEKLPRSYAGCYVAEDDRWVQAFVYRCSSGQRMVTFGRHFYAAKGEVITESEVRLADNQEFQKAVASCGA